MLSVSDCRFLVWKIVPAAHFVAGSWKTAAPRSKMATNLRPSSDDTQYASPKSGTRPEGAIRRVKYSM